MLQEVLHFEPLSPLVFIYLTFKNISERIVSCHLQQIKPLWIFDNRNYSLLWKYTNQRFHKIIINMEWVNTLKTFKTNVTELSKINILSCIHYSYYELILRKWLSDPNN